LNISTPSYAAELPPRPTQGEQPFRKSYASDQTVLTGVIGFVMVPTAR